MKGCSAAVRPAARARAARARLLAMADGVVTTTATLASLNEQADAVRAELEHLRQDLAQVQQDFSEARAVQLLEANEQLVLAALRAEAIAETALSNLGDVT